MLNYTKTPIGVVIASVGASLNLVTNATTVPSSLTTGQIGIYVDGVSGGVSDDLGNLLTGNFRFIWKDKNGKIHFTDTVNLSGVTSGNGSTILAEYSVYAAPAAQVSYVGYNGSTGSITVYDSEPYNMTLYMRNSSIDGGHLHNAYPKHVGGFTTSVNATQEEIALATAYAGYKNFQEEPVMRVQFDAICNAAVTAANCFDHDVTVVRGTNVISVATDLAYNTAAGTAAVGDYIRINGPTASNTTLQGAVYKITAVNTLNLTLDRPVTQASGTYAAADDECEVIPSATGLAADWGVRLVGLELFTSTYGLYTTNYWSLDGRMQYDVNTFTIAFPQGFDDTTLTYTTAASRGKGSYWEVAEREYFTQGYDGKLIYTGYPAFIPIQNTVYGYTYNVWTINWTDDGSTSEVTGLSYKQPKTIEVYINASDTTGRDDMHLALGTSN